MKVWKRNVVVVAVIVFVCIAAYLNWIYSAGDNYSDEYEQYESGKMLGEATLVDNDISDDAAEEVSGDKDAEAIETITDNTYFSDARLSRQKARDSALSILNDSTAAEDMSEQAKQEVSAQIEMIATNALKESNIESLIKAKGYEDCVAFISEDGISIVVAAPEGGLNQADAAKITDIVLSETGISDKIKIIEVN